ncbi:type II toxin-antitoxin system RatA family toxin [Kistimonas asteriae]|uniref:type II toxin-antitoxin system RatA family toxin n=1 Tax=Kistimonas asteriae TaxID=517724 RepID=UPI001BA5323C|nr:SRPBCC family protein [Kistimonas asteriae]
MRNVRLSKLIYQDAAIVFEKISDFKNFEKLCDDVISIDIEELSACEKQSKWMVYFKEGILLWVENDVFEPEEFRISFSQVEGDLDDFSGYWFVKPISAFECELTFEARFSIDIPTLEEMVEPLAASILKDNVQKMLDQLFK